MSDFVRSLPNNQVVVICEISNNKNNTYTLIPVEVGLGKIDDKKVFHSEDNKQTILPVEVLKKTKSERYYVFANSIEKIIDKYNIKSDTLAMIKYFKEISSRFLLAVDENDSIKVYSMELSKMENAEEIVSEKVPVLNRQSALKSINLDKIDIEDLEKYLKERIFNNDEILEDICTTIAMNYSATNRHEVESMLSVGTTGSGKTETYRLIAEYLGLPLTIYGCDQLTAAGYVGKDMDDVLRCIYSNSKGNIYLANKSIVVFDEIDKIASRGNDVTDLSVQYELLKFLEGGEYTFSSEKRNNGNKQITLDTSFMTISGSGAFSSLFEKKSKSLGFASNNEEKEKNILTTQDFLDYGMISELMSRFSSIHTYKTLTEEDLKNILINSLNSPLLLKKARYLRQFGLELLWDEEFINALAKNAYEKKAGGRSLSKVVATTFKKLDHELLISEKHERDIPKRLTLKPDIVYDPSKFIM